MAHRYWRIYCADNRDHLYCGFGEIELRESIGGSDATGFGTASASTEQSGNEASKAVDNNGATLWGSYSGAAPQWWKYDFGSGQAKDINEVAITPRTDGWYNEAPTLFYVQYSDDDSAWTTKAIVAAIWPDATQQVFDVSGMPAAGSDTFTGDDDDPVDSDKWWAIGSPDIQSNSAEVTFPEKLVSKITYTGDFDIQVDFNIPSPPAANSWNCVLYVLLDAKNQVYIGPMHSAAYDSKFQVGVCRNGSWDYYSNVNRTNTYGKIRITRVGTTFRCYFKDGDDESWTQNENGWSIGSSGDPCAIQISNGSWDTNPSITCRYDNYTVVGEEETLPEPPTEEGGLFFCHG